MSKAEKKAKAMPSTRTTTPEQKKAARREAAKKLFLGNAEKRGLLSSICIYVLLITIAFIYLYPVLYMLSRSLMGKADLLDSSVKWIPSALNWKNYQDAMLVMDYWSSLYKNLVLALVPTVAQVLVCSFVGYGFARYNFPGKMLWMGILVLSFLLPTQTTSLPNYLLFRTWGLADGSVKPFLLTAILGQGFKSALCILIFWNFHNQVPKSLIEASEIDGAGHFYSYFRIAVPLSTAAIVVVTLFSFVWYWNETYLVREYLGREAISNRNIGLTTLMIELSKFDTSYGAASAASSTGSTSVDKLSEAMKMAGTMLAILPMLILYFVLQKQFVESVDRAGITGE